MEMKLPLADVLDEVANELIAADNRAKARGKAVMTFEECEVEFAVSFEMKGDAGLKLYVVNVGVGTKGSETNKVKIKFKADKSVPMQAQQQQPKEAKPTPRQTRPAK